MAERIIVGINGSQADDEAVEWAATRASREGSSLLLVAVVDPEPRVGTLEGVETWANDQLEVFVKTARAIAPNVEIRTELHRNSSLPAAFDEMSDHGDLLVIGNDSVSESKGSQNPGAVRVAAASQKPVVSVPNADYSGRRGVLVGSDGSEISAKAIEFAAAEAHATGEPLIAVIAWQSDVAYGYGYGYAFAYVDDFQEALQESCREELDEALRGVVAKYPALEIERVVVEGRPADALLKHADRARLLVVGTHGRGAFRRLLLGSVSHELLVENALPTAVIR